MAKMVIQHYLDECIACGACVRECPKFWEIAKGAKWSHLKGSKTDEKNVEILEVEEDKLGCNKDAADVCPTQCIQIKKK